MSTKQPIELVAFAQGRHQFDAHPNNRPVWRTGSALSSSSRLGEAMALMRKRWLGILFSVLAVGAGAIAMSVAKGQVLLTTPAEPVRQTVPLRTVLPIQIG